MRTVKTITGVIDIALGLLFLAIAVLCVAYLPNAWTEDDREPEDPILLTIYFLLSAYVGMATLLSGIIPYRDQGDFSVSVSVAIWMLIPSFVVLGTLAAIGFYSADPITGARARVLIVAALAQVWSICLLRKVSKHS